jgi:radical SAM superfamily enzyme YgiQ (UPF0313 family)
MSRYRKRIGERRRRILAAEKGNIVKEGAYPLEIALVYPNTYEVGTSNLGFQLIYHLLNSFEEVRCERVFLDPALSGSAEDLPVSLEGGRPLKDFSMIAFSISFENDYANIVRLLLAAGIAPESRMRGEDDPLVLVGGPCAFMNPEPIAPFVDLFALGDGEILVPVLVRKWLDVVTDADRSGKDDYIETMAGEDGFYAPGSLEISTGPGGEISSLHYSGGEDGRVKRVWSDRFGEGILRLLSPASHFSNMPLVEIGSGCSRGCRFCAASFIYRPPRKRSLSDIREEIDRLLPLGDGKIGLVGSALSDYPDLFPVLEHIASHGGGVGLSSLRLDGFSGRIIEILSRMGVKTLTCAPEAGSQRMREIIKKSLTREDILESIEVIGRNRIANLKLYFMIGLPFERDEDVESIVELVDEILGTLKKHQSPTRLSLKINPFVPKPFTPFQWSPMEGEAELRRKMDLLRKRFRGERTIALKSGSLRNAVTQAILSRGDRRIATCLEESVREGSSLAVAMRRGGVDRVFYLYQERSMDEIFPWDFIDHGIQKARLYREYSKAEERASGGVE